MERTMWRVLMERKWEIKGRDEGKRGTFSINFNKFILRNLFE